MIRYRLRCAAGHEFDAWFHSSDAFDVQLAGGQVACGICGSGRVEKAPMAPSVARSARAEVATRPIATAAAETPAIRGPVTNLNADLAEAARRFRAEVAAHAEYVGPRFAAEARRIDQGDAEERGIYGEATAEEARGLLADGIAVLPLPKLPEEHN